MVELVPLELLDEPDEPTVPEVLDASDVGAPVRRWWELNRPEVMTGEVSIEELPTIADAIGQLSMVSLAHLMQVMTGERPPGLSDDEWKARSRVALGMAPRMVAEFKGRINPQSEAPGAVRQEATDGKGLTGLLAKYRIGT